MQATAWTYRFARRAFEARIFLFAVAMMLGPAVAKAADLYPDIPNAKLEIHQALEQARAEHKRVILDFGGNWCGDCKVLDYYFHQSPNDALLAKNFVVVDINIGRYDMNTDIAEHYGIPLNKGVPALAVLSPTGELLYAQRAGEFESMGRVDPSSITDFLNRWKPKR